MPTQTGHLTHSLYPPIMHTTPKQKKQTAFNKYKYTT